MNKTHQALCEEVQMLRDTLEQMEAEEGQEITDLRQRLQASQQNEENLMIRVRYLEARLVKAGEINRELRRQVATAKAISKPDGCAACASRPGQYHAPECPAVNAFTAGRIPAGGAE